MYYKMKDGDNCMFPRELVKIAESGNCQNSHSVALGGLGSGKSTTIISIAETCARLLAKDYDGEEEEWRKYFDINKNLACMNMKSILEVHNTMSKSHMKVFCIDDFSPVFGSRDFGKSTNKDQSSLMLVGRPNENICLWSSPLKQFYDINVRRLTNYEIQMGQQYFRYGYSSAKIFKIEQKPEGGDPYRKHLQDGKGNKFLLHFFKKCSPELFDAYTIIRKKAQKELEDAVIARLKKAEDNTDDALNVSKKVLYQQIYKSWKEGAFGTMSLREVCEERNLNLQSLKNANKGFIPTSEE